METLSIFAPLHPFLGSTKLKYDLGLAPISRRNCRNNIWVLSRRNCCCFSHPNGFLGGKQSKNLIFSSEFCSRGSKLGFLKLVKPKMRFLSVSFASVTDSVEETSRSSEYSQEQKVTAVEKEVATSKSVLVAKEDSKRIDVRELAQKLWDCETADSMEKVFDELGEPPPPPVYSSLIRGFGRDKRLNCAFALVDWLKRKRGDEGESVGPNLFIYNSLLGAIKQANEFERVDQVMEAMLEDDIVPNIVTYNALMSIHIEEGCFSEALDVLSRIEKEGLSPSPVTYSTALLAYWRMEDVHGALGLYVELRRKYENGEIRKAMNENWEDEFLKLDDFIIRICYQVMRQWIVKRDDPASSVMRLLTEIDKARVAFGRMQYEKLIWACTQEGHYVVAKEFYTRLREKGSGISLSVCNHVIWLMGKAKKWWAALEIYEDLLDKGPKPNNLSYELIMSHFNILLSAASKRGIWRWGIRLINKMQEKGLKPGPREWNAVLVACSKASEASAAVEIFRRMIEQGEKPTILSYGALLSALEKGKLYDEAFKVWEHMCKVGIKPNLHAYTILATIYVGMGEHEQVDSVIRDMVSSGIEPTVVTYNAIISSCVKINLSSVAFEWFHRMKVRNVSPNEVTYEVLIEALARDAKPRLAFEMYLQAKKESMLLSAKTYDSVLESCRLYDASVNLTLMGPRPYDSRKSIHTRKTSSESS